MRKHTWLTTDDVEQHFCDLLDIGIFDVFDSVRQFIETFSDDPGNRAACLNHLTQMQLGMEGPYA